MKHFLLSLLCICALQISGNAQYRVNKDSLFRLLKTAREDSNKVNLLFDIGDPYENSAPQIAKQYYNQALKLSKKIGYIPGEIKYASYYTSALNVQGRFDSSLVINLQALQLAKKTGNPLFIVKTTFNTANSYGLIGQNDSTIFYYMQALPVLEKMENPKMLAVAYNNLITIYANLGQYAKGIEYGKRATPVLRALKDSVKLEYNLTNLGENYNSLKNYKTALSYFDEAIAISKKLGDKYAESALHLNLGDIDYQLGKYEESKNRFEQALQIARKLNLAEKESIALKGFAMYYLQTKKYIKAKNHADTALLIAQKNSILEQQLKIYKLLSDISYANQDERSAKEYGIKADQLNDSIHSDNLQKVIAGYEKKYESAKKDNQIKEQQNILKQRRVLNFLLSGIVIAMLLIAILGYRNFKHRQKLQQAKIDELEIEKQLTATEAVLKGEERERTRLAKDLHDGLGGMLSGIKHSLNNMKGNMIMTPDNALAFERSIDMLDSSIKEMRRVAHNMMPEILVRYGLDAALNEFCDEISRSGVTNITYQSIGMKGNTMEQTTAVAIYRIVQELVNNAIKHAAAKNILVQAQASEAEKLIALTVEDDGKGFDKTILQQARGMGWSNIQSRVDFLRGRIDISSEKDKGTSVLIEINDAG